MSYLRNDSSKLSLGKWGLLNQSGKTILPFIYDFINVDESGDISLEIDKLNGKADAQGHIFVPVSYQSVGTFHADGYATAVSGGRYGLIDRDNHWVLPAIFSSIDRFDNGTVFEGSKRWIIDRKGRRQFGTKFDRFGGFSAADGLRRPLATSGEQLTYEQLACRPKV